MDYLKHLARIASALVCAFGALSAWAADYPAPREAYIDRSLQLPDRPVLTG